MTNVTRFARHALFVVCASVLSGETGACLFAESDSQDPAALEFFEKQVRPLLVANCYNCHSASNKAAGGLRVDDRHGLLQGGNRGPAVVVGDPASSVLLKAVQKTDPKLQMPPDSTLSEEEIAILTKWIKQGAVWPAVKLSEDQTAWSADYDGLRANHWAWQPLKKSTPPAVQHNDWAWSDVDHFVLAGLEARKLNPVEDANRVDLLRRLTFDLTGLPPTPADIQAFVSDASPNAVETVVDRLLASSAYGERWGRHWLDVARYGESTGSARNLPYPHAWRYRDYVIQAFNSDKPYDQFIREQVAGDLLPSSSPEQRDEQLIATGFLALGVKDVNQRFKVRFIMDNIDEQIDTLSRSVLALTVSCARCHNHKFDPIPATDYYALAGIFHSTDLCGGLRNKMGGGGLDYYDTSLLLTLSADSGVPAADLAEKVAAAEKAVAQAKADFEALQGTPEGLEKGPNGRPKQQQARQKWNRLQAELVALSDPAARGIVAHGVRDAAQVGDTEIRVRGEAEQLGPVVPRGFLSVVQVPDAPSVNPQQSGRLELAQWLTSPQNPLTQRVVVNRVWQHLFGEGLVTTVDNFGTTGVEPSHPELLDYLALQFVEDGSSIKRLIRRLVLSRTYQLSSQATPEHLTVDPQNRWLWRHPPRRLEAEEIRDAMLAASGELNPHVSPPSAAKELAVREMRNNGPEAAAITAAARSSRYRSIYLPLVRTLVPGSLEVFDFAEQGMVTGHRDNTTVPSQALYLLNDPFVIRQSQGVARQVLQDASRDDADRLATVYQLVLGRSASESEISRARFYLTEYAQAAGRELADHEEETSASPEDNVAPAAAKVAVAANANPDDVDQDNAVITDKAPRIADAREAAWTSFVQALFASAEFRYLK